MCCLKTDSLRAVLRYLPDKIVSVMNGINTDFAADLCEIRLKVGLPVVLVFTDRMLFITSSGRLTEYLTNDLISVSENELKDIFMKMCKFSVYSLADNIADGFITIECGCRVGVYGTAVVRSGVINSVRNIKGLNIRIAGQVVSAADGISELYRKSPVNTLICGPPSSGKTTILKDLCRTLSDRYNYKVSIIDERCEFDGMYLGVNTDVLTGYPKPDGIMISVRTLSPQIIVCDELGDVDEVNAVLNGLNCGVNFVMTLHCSSYEELTLKRQFALLKKSCLPDYCVFLKNKGLVEKIVTPRVSKNENTCADIFVPDKHIDGTVLRA